MKRISYDIDFRCWIIGIGWDEFGIVFSLGPVAIIINSNLALRMYKINQTY